MYFLCMEWTNIYFKLFLIIKITKYKYRRMKQNITQFSNILNNEDYHLIKNKNN